MSQAAVVMHLALRELWITFRLLLLLTGFVAVGALVALLPAALPDVLQRLAIGIGIASLLVASIGAWSFAAERTRGRAAWLVTRSVSRGTLLLGWFGALAVVGIVGVALAGVLGWLTASGVSLRLDAGGFAVLFVGIAATGLAWIALGLLLATVFRGTPAAVLTLLVGGGLGLAAWIAPGAGELVPGAAWRDLASLRDGATVTLAPLRIVGSALVATGVLLGLARLALERAEL